MRRPKVHFHLIIIETLRCFGEAMVPYSKAHGINAMKAVEWDRVE